MHFIFRRSCFLLIGFIVSLCLLTTSSFAEITFKDCDSTDKTKIKNAITWLKKNIRKIDQRMGKNNLMSWPGKSRSKFIKKLSKNLRFVCKNSKKKCNKQNKDGTVLFGKVVPVFQQKTIQLCSNNFLQKDKYYVSTIAHEIAHLIRLNAHRTNCKKMFEKPRFSKSVGLAAYHAYLGTDYRHQDYTKDCK